jgi:hypothetical protein
MNEPTFTMDQLANYNEIMRCTYTDACTSADYFAAGAASEGVEYWCPNDEDWGTIIAVHHGAKMAMDTTFFEMDDIEGSPEDYGITLVNNELVMGFER